MVVAFPETDRWLVVLVAAPDKPVLGTTSSHLSLNRDPTICMVRIHDD